MKILLISLTILAFLSGILIKVFSNTHSLKHDMFQTDVSTVEDLGTTLFHSLQRQDTVQLAKLLPTSKEYVQLHSFLREQGENPDAGKFLAMLMTQENYKALRTWISPNTSFQGLHHPFIKGPASVQHRDGIEIWQGISLWAKDSEGNPVQIPIIKSVIRSADGFKIYTLIPSESH